MSTSFREMYKSLGGRVGKALQLVVEYETKQNGRNVRAFETQAEYDQWCMEMGENITVVSIRKGGEPQALSKSFIVRAGGQDHMCTDDEKEAKAYLQLLREGGTFAVLVEQTVIGGVGKARRVTKPGDANHTAKWDRCVEHVRSTSPGADPFAVCTAMLGDESFKAMDEAKMDGVIDKALEKLGQFGIAGAGPIPESLLARQDLEGSTKKSGAFTSQHDLIARIKGNQKAPLGKGGSFRDAWAGVRAR